MDGVVTLLGNTHRRQVEALWEELRRELGIRKLGVDVPFPHLSHHVADGYDLEHLEAVLRDFARTQGPVMVVTTGLGIFTGPSPVLWIPVVRTAELSAFQLALSQAVGVTASEVLEDYAPAAWMPHITLAQGDMDADLLAEAIRLLSGRTFVWHIVVDHVAALCHEDEGRRVAFRFALDG